MQESVQRGMGNKAGADYNQSNTYSGSGKGLTFYASAIFVDCIYGLCLRVARMAAFSSFSHFFNKG